MTNLEKLQLLEGDGFYIRVQDKINPVYEGQIDVTLRYNRNSTSTYFYWGKIWKGEFHESLNSNNSNYYRIDNHNKQEILDFLDRVICILDKHLNVLWKEPVINLNGVNYYAIKHFYVNETQLKEAYDISNELKSGILTVNNKKYKLSDLEHLIEAAENIIPLM